MNKNVQLVINVVLGAAVAVLFSLYFHTPRGTTSLVPADAAVVKTAVPDVAPVETVAESAEDSVAVSADTDAATDASAAAAPTTDTTPAIRKVGYVKSGELLEGYKGMQSARAAYEAKLGRWEKEHQAAVAAFQSAVQAYQAKAGSMLDGQRREQEEKLQQQEQQVAQRQQQLQQQAAEEEGKLNEQVLGRVNKLLERYGKEHDFDLILVAGNGSVAYGKPGLDLTQIILKQLNAEYAAGKR